MKLLGQWATWEMFFDATTHLRDTKNFLWPDLSMISWPNISGKQNCTMLLQMGGREIVSVLVPHSFHFMEDFL